MARRVVFPCLYCSLNLYLCKRLLQQIIQKVPSLSSAAKASESSLPGDFKIYRKSQVYSVSLASSPWPLLPGLSHKASANLLGRLRQFLTCWAHTMEKAGSMSKGLLGSEGEVNSLPDSWINPSLCEHPFPSTTWVWTCWLEFYLPPCKTFTRGSSRADYKQLCSRDRPCNVEIMTLAIKKLINYVD